MTALLQAASCPECGCEFVVAQTQQLFCCPAHRDAWNNRWTVRGRVGAPLLAVARSTRNGTRGGTRYGERVSRDVDTLLRRWRMEDMVAGRMPLGAYLDRRYDLGFDPI